MGKVINMLVECFLVAVVIKIVYYINMSKIFPSKKETLKGKFNEYKNQNKKETN